MNETIARPQPTQPTQAEPLGAASSPPAQGVAVQATQAGEAFDSFRLPVTVAMGTTTAPADASADTTTEVALPDTVDLDLDVLSDPELLAWWWNSHSHLPIRVRHEIAVRTIPLCRDPRCVEKLELVRDELELYVKPMTASEAFSSNLRQFALEHPFVAAFTGLCIAGLFLRAGMALPGVIKGLLQAIGA